MRCKLMEIWDPKAAIFYIEMNAFEAYFLFGWN